MTSERPRGQLRWKGLGLSRFRECLQSANSSAAAIVGRVYFGVMNSQCFHLEREKVTTPFPAIKFSK